MDAAIEHLEKSPIFSRLDATALALVASVARPRTFAVGEDLFRAGGRRTHFFLILRGQVEVRVERGTNAGFLLILGRGDGAGEAGFLAETQHSSTGTAITEVETLEIPLAEMRTRLAGNGEAAMQVMAGVARLMVRRLRYAAYRRSGWSQVYRTGTSRKEHDLLGEREIPNDARYGVQTLRAVENFPITGIRIAHFPHLIRSLAMVKQAAARANHELGLLPPDVAQAIDRACKEVIRGHWHGHFVVDVVQGGAGTSTNMNANEVIANRALELLGHDRGDYAHCHPNNHVNLSQSTNDAYPTAVLLATSFQQRELAEALRGLVGALRAKAVEFADVLKMGRTQLQDAVPMTLGQEFEALAVTTAEDIARLEDASNLLLEINLGGTAIGTGINADPRYPARAVEALREISGLDLQLAENLVEATMDTGAFVAFSGVLKRIVVKLSKMCNDLRLLSSGPRCGFNEINLPPMQPGSSIMPGKVNPVIPEVVNQVAFQVIGNDLTITLAAEAGQLQLNVMEPVLAFNLFESLDMMTAAVRTLTERCIRGITANRDHCRSLVEQSIGIVTAVVPALGYERATQVAKEALETGRPVRQILQEGGDLSDEEIDAILSPDAMTTPRPMKPLE